MADDSVTDCLCSRGQRGSDSADRINGWQPRWGCTKRVSIQKIGDELRQIVGSLPFAGVRQAIDRLDEAMIAFADVGQGSVSGEFEQVLAHLHQGAQQVAEANQTLHTVKMLIERFIANIGATGGEVGLASTSPTRPTAGVRRGERAGGEDRHVDHALIGEVQRQGHKISADRVMRIGRDQRGKVLWIEQGDDRAGVAHLLDVKRVGDFTSFGIAQNDIVDVVFKAATEGVPVGVTGIDRVVFLVDYHGKPMRIAVSIGKNGFIVGGNPVSLTRKLKPLP